MFSRRWSKPLRLESKRLQIESLEERIVMAAAAVAGSPLPEIKPVAVQTSAALQTTEEWVHSLTYNLFNQLLPEHIQYLTTAQIATIPNTSYFGAISAASRAMFNAPQVQALNVANIRINLLTQPQIGFLTTAQVRSLPFYDFEFLNAAQIPLLTTGPTGQIASISGTAVFDTWTAAAKAALTVPQVQSLNMSVVRPTALSATQISWLTIPQIQLIANYDLNLLAANQIPYVSTAQIASIPTAGFFAAWSASARAALSSTQIQAINPAALSLPQLTTTQIGALLPAQIQGLPFWDFPLLSAAQIPLLTSAQIVSINTEGALNSWSSAARAALTITQVRSLNMSVIRPTVLTATQLPWLTATQIQLIANYDFNVLLPSQIPYLTTAQITSIPTAGFFAGWSASARAALTGVQIQAINPAALSLPLLTAAQIGALLPAQVQTVPFWDLWLLTPTQIPLLTSAQVGAVTSLSAWSVASRGALTALQVPSLNVALVRIELLTAAQRLWLTTPQVRSLAYYDFVYLWPAQVAVLTAAQLNTIPTVGVFAAWTPEARAAMTAAQMPAITTGALSLAQWTPQQIGWLSPVQIQSVPVYELQLLAASQIPYLTTTQIAGIDARAYLAAWTPAARAALAIWQVRALDVANAGIALLTPTQVGWLTTAQLQVVAIYEYPSLNPSQIPLLSPDLFASIQTAGSLYALPDDSKAMLTRAQLLNLPADVWAEYSLAMEAPSVYHPAIHLATGADGLQVHPSTATEIARFFALAPVELATHRTVASGDWTNPAVWLGGVVPTAGAKVLVSAGTTVRFNAFMNTAIDTLRIDGTLQFATNQNTQLKVDTILVTTTGKLHVGTAAAPIQNNVTARILIADNGPINLTRDPYQLGRGLVSRGEVRMHGMAVTPYATLAVQPVAGATTLYLSAAPSNWRVGDRIVVTGTIATRDDFGADEVTILAINGSQVTTTPLQFSHPAPAGYGLSVHVANLNRNVILTAEDSSVVAERPHMVFFHNPNVAIDNIGVYGFGRTDKSVAVTDPVVVNGVLQPGTGANPRARYAFHFHHTGVNPAYAPAVVRGSIVEGSPGWGYVNHSSNVDFIDNVAYKIEGSAFVTEDGNEIGSMVRNLAINTTGSFDGITSRSNIHDFGFNGHGFWFQGPGIEVVDNISAGSLSGGFSYFTESAKNKFDAVNLEDPALAAGFDAVPVDTVPFNQFSGNTAYAGRAGLEIWHHMSRLTDGQSFVDDFTSWNNRVAGIDVYYSGQITVRNSTLIGDLSYPAGTGFYSNRFTHDITFENLHAAGFQVGVIAPVRGATNIVGGYFAAVQAIYIEKGYDTQRTVDINGAITFATLNIFQLQGRRQYSVYMSTYVDYAAQVINNPNSFFTSDLVLFRPDGSPAVRLYSYNQLKGMAPFTEEAAGSVPAEYINLRNAQLQFAVGKVFGGEMISKYNAFERASIFGMFRAVS